MLGICIELKTSCKHCSQALMLNAFTEDILCSSCNQINSFSQETWHSLLEDAVKEAPKFQPGEGQPSTIMRGEYTYSLMYGRQEPRCGKCKENIDITKLEEYSTKGNIECSKCANHIFIRKPSELVTKSFRSIQYLVGEDDYLLSANKAGANLPASAKPVLFTCPACAGNLQIDGTQRMVTCKFCDSQIYLPDDLWFRLHPAKVVERWYMVVEGIEVKKKADLAGSVSTKPEIDIPKWYYLSDVCMDKAGNLYVASATDGDEDALLWSLSPNLETRWVRDGIKFNYDRTGICVTNDKQLYLWDSGRHSLLKISSKDGSTIKKMEGDPTRKNLNMKGCTSVVSCPDGTILAVINNTFARFRENGERVSLWSTLKYGLFPSGKGGSIPDNDDEYAPYIKDVGSSPRRINGSFTKMVVGWDGYIYMADRSSSDGEVAKYEMSGKRIWSKYIPLDSKDCKPGIDGSGNIYMVGSMESNSKLVRFNKKASRFDTILKDIKQGSYVNNEDKVVVSPSGMIYLFKFYNRLKVFTPDLKLSYRSEQSKKEDEEVLQRKKEAIEKDEEFA